jgi:dihydroorotate dehydrogenase
VDIYKTVVRPFLFSGIKIDPEFAHHHLMQALSALDRRSDPLTHWLNHQMARSFSWSAQPLQQSLWGLSFANPIGLAAGFDKDGVAAGLWSAFGFGYVELGTVTFHPQPGNPPPRLFRLPQDHAILNRMGFNNQGAAVLAERLQQRQQRSNQLQSQSPVTSDFPIGINLGKSKITPLEAAAADYLNSFRLLKPWGDYFVVNVSSPNTPGLRTLQSADQLDRILDILQTENQSTKPLLVKIAPDLTWEEIESILVLTQTYGLSGIVATNTTIRRDHLHTQMIDKTGLPVTEEAGGISGAPLRDRSTEVIRFIYQQTQGKLPIIGVGGIFTAQDAWEKIIAGASLLQVYTGWIYEGPWMVQRILQGLSQQLEAHQCHTLAEAIGLDSRS